MSAILTKLTETLKRFRRAEHGTATIEAVLWLPLFFAFFGLLVDVSMIFNGQSHVLRVTQDANRSLSLGRFDTPLEASTFIEARLERLAPNANAVTTINSGMITSTVSVPIGDLEFLGLFASLSDATMTVAAEHLVEY